MHTSALVLFSGGQDSTTCLAHALARYERVETITFDDGQRHRIELEPGGPGAALRLGYGCGACPACELRARGFEKFTAVTP